jgi:hypothetical protein
LKVESQELRQKIKDKCNYMETSSGDRRTTESHDHKTTYIRNIKAISGRLHDEMVMMDIDQGKYFSLNPVATRIWDLLEKPKAAEEICAILIDEYDVEPSMCTREVEEYLTKMVLMGLILRER